MVVVVTVVKSFYLEDVSLKSLYFYLEVKKKKERKKKKETRKFVNVKVICDGNVGIVFKRT